MQLNVDLGPLNTLALPGRAAFYTEITRSEALSDKALADLPRFILGGGSNWVLTGDFDGLVMHMKIPGKRFIREDEQAFYVQAGAGEKWHDFVQWTLSQGYPGLENLSMIPGTVGAAPIQNIGAYGLEVGERIDSISAWDFHDRRFLTLTHTDCEFAYRTSCFKKRGWHEEARMVVCSVVFRLPKRWVPILDHREIREIFWGREPRPEQLAEAVMAIRRSKLPDPAVLPNAGSFFQNPLVSCETGRLLQQRFTTLPLYPQVDGKVKLPAGWLIEQVGWKGKSIGRVGMFEKQALVLVNHGAASGEDVLKVMQQIQEDVFQLFQVRLEPEPVIFPARGSSHNRGVGQTDSSLGNPHPERSG